MIAVGKLMFHRSNGNGNAPKIMTKMSLDYILNQDKEDKTRFDLIIYK